MSYQTNPILNRIKIRKGWKNSYFPLKSLNYSHETILWFKLYLLLKNYLFLQKIIVLACEIRLSENHQKILYLSVTKEFQKKKLPKSKWKSKSLLRDSKSLLAQLHNKKARFLLYQDLETLKKNSTFFFNQTQKKILLKTWIAKSRFSSWINLSKSTNRIRQQIKSKLYLTWKKKKNFSRKKKTNQIVKQTIFKNPMEKDLFSKQLFWQRKQRKLLALLRKTQKELFFIEQNFHLISCKHVGRQAEFFYPSKIKNTAINKLFITLVFKYSKLKILLEKTQKLYTALLTSNFTLSHINESISQKKLMQSSYVSRQSFIIQEKRRTIQLDFFWRILKKKLWTIQTKNLSFSNKKRLFAIWQSTIFKRTQKYCLMDTSSSIIFSIWFILYTQKIQPLFIKHFFLCQNNQLTFIYKKILKNILKKKIQLLNTLPKTKFLQKRRKILPWHLPQLVRFKQKIKISFLKKEEQTLLKLKRTFKAVYKKKKTNIDLIEQYRIPSHTLYKNHLNLWTGFRLKYLLQNLLQKYFGLNLMIKISWPLMEFKNLKFYRLLFPNYKASKSEDNLQQNVSNLKLNEKNSFKQNHYLSVGYMTKHLQLREPLSQLFEKSLFSTPLYANSRTFNRYAKKTILSKMDLKESKNKQIKNIKNILQKKTFVNGKNQRKNEQAYIFLTKFKKQPLKKNSYTILKSKILQKKSQKRLFWASKTPDLGNFLTTLTLFAKYLNPQPLATYLAKLVNQSKNHSSILKFIETVLHALPMKRGIGYRIALTGRIDGANKSRTLYLRKLNRNRARQTFSKNVNFAMAHARANIGVFSIKLWVYS